MYILSTTYLWSLNMAIDKELMQELERSSDNIPDAFYNLFRILQVLRSPDGCPWDREQYPEKFSKNLIEEAYEYIEALQNQDITGCCEELGDMFLVTTMLTIMHQEEKQFNMIDVLNMVSEKMIRRHPHIFTDTVKAANSDEVLTLWNSIKENIEGKVTKQDNFFSKINKSLPPLEQAYEIQKAVRKIGFDWEDPVDAEKKIYEEISEFKDELLKIERNNSKIEEEMGDILFSIINYARLHKIDPGLALKRTNYKFMKRFNHMKKTLDDRNIELNKDNFIHMDACWNEIKNN